MPRPPRPSILPLLVALLMLAGPGTSGALAARSADPQPEDPAAAASDGPTDQAKAEGTPDEPTDKAKTAADPDDGAATKALDPPVAKAPSPAPPPSPPDPAEPLYSMEASHQDAVALIMEYARRANQTVTLPDSFATRISVRFKDLPFEKGLRRIMEAADLDFVKDADGYTIGLPCDLKVRFPGPDDKIVDGTYRCRRISAATLVKTIQAIMGEADIKASPGPEFLTPAVEAASTGSGDLSIKALAPTDPNYHTHDVVFSGAPNFVARALSLARKFDQPRKQVRVNVRIVEISSSFERNLGVSWMNSLGLKATERMPTTTDSNGYSTASTRNGLSVGHFDHDPLSLTATINALETQGEAKTLSNPNLLVLDGEKSFILSGTKYVYPQFKGKDSAGNPEYDITTEKVGVYLQVGVQVGLDDDMVLTIYPQVTEVLNFQSINGGNYPIISTNEEQATVRAIKGDVIVLGGIRIEDSSLNTPSVPFLGSLPIIGSLFSSPHRKRDAQELMIFLTPEIVEEAPPALELTLESRPRGEAALDPKGTARPQGAPAP
jgi:type II secretory pathway component GspD/PulD (secretin)